MAALGKHLLLELMDCDHELLNDVEYLREVLSDVARRIGATVIKDSFYQFTPQGVSGVVIIAESHVSIHTWPEHNFAADLGAESVQSIELVAMFEKEFGIEMEEDAALSVETVGGAVDFIRNVCKMQGVKTEG